MPLMKAYVIIGARLAPLRAGLRRARIAVSKATATMTAVSKKAFIGLAAVGKKAFMGLAAVGKKAFQILKKSIKKIAIALLAVGAAATYAFVKFETSMASVNTMLDEQTNNYLPRYSKQIKKMAKIYGESTSILAEGLYNILSASIPASKAIDVLTISVKAGKAGITDTSTAAYAITGILNAYGMSADKAGRVSDILFSTVKAGQTTFAQLAPAIGRVTAIAASADVALQEVGAALATITRGGIGTNEAITGLRAAIISLMGKEEGAIKLAKQHGIELSIRALKTKGLVGMIQKLSQLQPEVLKNIFKETEARLALNVLIKDQTGFVKDYNSALSAAGVTEEAFAKQTDTLGFKLSKLKQSFIIMGIAIGDAISPATEIATTELSKLTGKIETFFVENKYTIGEGIDKIWARMKTFWDLVVDLWKGDDLSIAIKYGLDVALAQFEKWGEQVGVLMEGIGGIAAHAISTKFAEDFGKFALKIIEPEGLIGKLIGLTPAGTLAQIGIGKAATAMMETALEAKPPSMAEVFKRARGITAREVPIPPELGAAFEKFKEAIDKQDRQIEEMWRQIKEEDENASSLADKNTQIADKNAQTADKNEAAAASKFGIVGIKEAWSRMVTGMTAPERAYQEEPVETIPGYPRGLSKLQRLRQQRRERGAIDTFEKEAAQKETTKAIREIGKRITETFEEEIQTQTDALAGIGAVGP